MKCHIYYNLYWKNSHDRNKAELCIHYIGSSFLNGEAFRRRSAKEYEIVVLCVSSMAILSAQGLGLGPVYPRYSKGNTNYKFDSISNLCSNKKKRK